MSAFPDEIYTAPQSWAERAYPKLIHYNRLDKGGHFAAWEQPEVFSAELRSAFRSLPLNLGSAPPNGSRSSTGQTRIERERCRMKWVALVLVIVVALVCVFAAQAPTGEAGGEPAAEIFRGKLPAGIAIGD